MFDKLKPYAKYVTAVLCGLAAANGVLGLVPVPVVSELLQVAGALGLYLHDSPVAGQ